MKIGDKFKIRQLSPHKWGDASKTLSGRLGTALCFLDTYGKPAEVYVTFDQNSGVSAGPTGLWFSTDEVDLCGNSR
jgi:hypothetical protein